ncbi:MAG: BsuPI-related putative proteinase inhibitor [Candidatus Cryosericum sp.]|nr:hypothetical protein [bacterium]
MKRLLIVLMVLALAVSVSVHPVEAADPPVGIRYAPPTVTLTTGKPSYAPGEAVDWRYTLYNGGDHPLELTFTSAQIYDLILRQNGKVVARWSAGKMFADVMSTRTIMMGETMELTGSWKVTADLAPGSYELEFVLTSTTTEPTGAKVDLTIGTATPEGISARFTTDKLIYRVGTRLTVKYTITNLSDRPLVLDFPTAQQFDWTITDITGNIIYHWSKGRAFAQVITHLTIPVGASDGFESSWDIPRDLAPSGFYIHFTVLADALGALKTQRAAVLMGSTPPPL